MIEDLIITDVSRVFNNVLFVCFSPNVYLKPHRVYLKTCLADRS